MKQGATKSQASSAPKSFYSSSSEESLEDISQSLELLLSGLSILNRLPWLLFR